MSKPNLADFYAGVDVSRRHKPEELISWGEAYPYLEMLMDQWTPDGAARKPMTLTVVLKAGRVRVKLTDHETDHYAWLDLADPMTIWEEIEQALDKRLVPWETLSEKWQKNGRRRLDMPI